MSRLTKILDQWSDSHRFPPSQRQVAEALGVSKSTVSSWKDGGVLPRPETLRAIARLTGTDYLTVLDAALKDSGFLQSEEIDRGNTAPTSRGGVRPPTDLSTRRGADEAPVTSGTKRAAARKKSSGRKPE